MYLYTASSSSYPAAKRPSLLARKRLEQNALPPPPKLDLGRPVMRIGPYTGVLKRPPALVDAKHVQHPLHRLGHVWLQQDADDAHRFRAHVDDARLKGFVVPVVPRLVLRDEGVCLVFFVISIL